MYNISRTGYCLILHGDFLEEEEKMIKVANGLGAGVGTQKGDIHGRLQD